jgi:acetyltransferase
VTIRPIRPEDEPLLVPFHEKLSDRTVYLRYFDPLKLSQRIAHERLARLSFIDYAREMLLVAETRDPRAIISAARLSKLTGTTWADMTVIITDEQQGKGLGTELVQRTLDVARAEGITRVLADILPESANMRHILEKAGFEIFPIPGSEAMRGELVL